MDLWQALAHSNRYEVPRTIRGKFAAEPRKKKHSALKKNNESAPKRLKLVDEVWRLFKLAWSVIQAALLPLDLALLPNVFEKLLDSLACNRGGGRRVKQISRFLNRLECG